MQALRPSAANRIVQDSTFSTFPTLAVTRPVLFGGRPPIFKRSRRLEAAFTVHENEHRRPDEENSGCKRLSGRRRPPYFRMIKANIMPLSACLLFLVCIQQFNGCSANDQSDCRYQMWHHLQSSWERLFSEVVNSRLTVNRRTRIFSTAVENHHPWFSKRALMILESDDRIDRVHTPGM